MSKLTKIATVTFACVLLSIAATSCAKKEPVKVPEGAPEGQDNARTPDEVQHKVLSFNLEGFNEKGAKKWDVTGQCAEAVSATEVKLDNIVAKAYGDEGEATITADSGIYDKANNNVRLKENVKATIQVTEGANAGFLDPGAGAGKAAKAPAADGEKRKKNTVITCDGDVQFDYEKNVAYFNTNVVVVTEDGTIVADKITVNLDPETKKLTTIVATGNVKIFKEGNTIYSDRATYIEAEKRIILSGKPKIVISTDGGVDTGFLGGMGGPSPAASDAGAAGAAKR